MPQLIRTTGPARPRNLAIGCLSVLVVAALLALCGRAVDEIDEQDDDRVEQTTLPAHAVPVARG